MHEKTVQFLVTAILFLQAVEELILGSSPETKIAENHIIITKRAEDHGYRHCGSFGQYLDRLAVTRIATPKQNASK